MAMMLLTIVIATNQGEGGRCRQQILRKTGYDGDISVGGWGGGGG